MKHTALLLRGAQKSLDKMDDELHRRIIRAIRQLEDDPFHSGVAKLANSDGLYRVRVGDLRIVYKVQKHELVVLVIRIAHRREVYRK